jgi:hypothetical protein
MYKSGCLLTEIKEFSKKQISKLAGYNISTVEEFVALASSSSGKKGLVKILDIDANEFSSLLDLAREYLPKHVREDMETPVDIAKFGFGALEPDFEPDDKS